MKRIAILISGRGSNMQAVLEAHLPVAIAVVISNDPNAAGLALAQMHGVKTQVVDHREFSVRAAFDDALADALLQHEPDLIVLAGFMRILGDAFVMHFQDRLINVHPSLLPAFAGTHTHRRALAEGVRVHGCTVHFVTPELDHGPIIVQAAVPVHADDTESSLAARVLHEEHRILPQAIRWFVEDRLSVRENRVQISGGCRYPDAITSPLDL
ncbi:MAG: phosphoribosylglycinamide formyltransferase [Betaproteobacteria bacterium]